MRTAMPARPATVALAVAVVAALAGSTAAASAANAPGWTIEQHEVDARVAAGGELGVDPASHRVFVADRDYYAWDNVRLLDPKIGIVDTARQTWSGAIGFGDLPWTMTAIYLADGVAPKVLPSPQVPVGLALDRQRRLVVTSNTITDSLTVVGMDATKATPSDLITVGGHPMGVGVNERTGLAYVASTTPGTVAVVDLARRKVVRTIDGVPKATMVSVDPVADKVYVGSFDPPADGAASKDAITVIDGATGTIERRVPTEPNIRPTVDAAAGKLYATSFATGHVTVFDTATWKPLRTIDTKTTPNVLALDAERHRLYSADLQKGTVTVIDGATDQVVATARVPSAPHSVAVDPESHLVYASHLQDGTVSVLRVTGPAPPETPTTTRRRLGAPRVARSGAVRVRVRIPVAGRLTARALARIGTATRTVASGRSGRLAAGRTASVRLRLSSRARAALRRRGDLPVRIRLRLQPVDGGAAPRRTVRVRLRGTAR